MARDDNGPSALRLRAPGCARDVRQQTSVAAELPFFNDAAMAQRLIETGLDPLLRHIPANCRLADFGGADGFLAQAIRNHLEQRGIRATAVVVDANAASLAVAQRRGLRIVPASLEHVRLSSVHLVVMRLVLHYNGLEAQSRILAHAFHCLAPGGYLLLQAEAGERGSAVFRNLLVRALERFGASNAPEAGCRWLSTEALERLARRRDYEIMMTRDDIFVFETRLSDLLRLSWTRFHGTPDTNENSRRQYASFCDYANVLAGRMMQRRSTTGLRINSAGEIRFVSRHALIVARKPVTGIRQHPGIGEAT
ncbi:MAG: class I SAM-dependent methyltransferase [Xanthobacteraceae bacterium]